MRRGGTVFLAVFLLLISVAEAKPRVKSVTVDGQGQGRVQMTQRQIFDEFGGKASVGLDLGRGLGVVTSDIELPEEMGDITGTTYATVLSDAVSIVGNFTYLPFKNKKLRLDIDYRSVEDENRARGVNTIAVDYPLTLENVGPEMARYLAKTSYTVTGSGKWSRYTEADGSLNIQVQNPDLRNEQAEIKKMSMRVVDHATTDITLHFEVPSGSQAAQALQSREALEYVLGGMLRGMGLTPKDTRVENIASGNGLLVADVKLSFFNLRQQLNRLVSEVLDHAPPPRGVRAADVAVAIHTMFGVEFNNLEITVLRKADHFDVDIEVDARKADQCILGYLRLMEILEPALIEAGTQNRGLSAFVERINGVKTRRFRNVLVAAAESQDGGKVDFDFKLRFPNGRATLDARAKYDSVLTAYGFASQMMRVPLVKQAYSYLKIKSTPTGLRGHYLYEAQGPWFESQWALWSEAAKGMKDFQAIFPSASSLKPREGRVAVSLDKSRVNTRGWLLVAELAPYVQGILVGRDAQVEPVGLDLRYDADAMPGVILGDLYLKAKTADALRKAVGKAFGSVRFQDGPKVTPAAVEQPPVELPAALAGEIEADRRLLGVTPWKAAPVAAAAPKSSGFGMGWMLAVAAGVLLSGGAFAMYLQRRQMQMAADAEHWGSATVFIPRGPQADPFAALVQKPEGTSAVEPVAASPEAAVGVPEPAAPPSPRAGPSLTGARPALAVSDRDRFRTMVIERIAAAWPDAQVARKDVLELTVTKGGMPQTVDLEPLYYLCQKPGINHDKAIQSFVARM